MSRSDLWMRSKGTGHNTAPKKPGRTAARKRDRFLASVAAPMVRRQRPKVMLAVRAERAAS